MSYRFANSFVYYGLSLNTSNLAGDPYINNMISGAVEIPAYLFIIWAFTKFGRVWPFSMSMIVGSVALLATMPVPQSKSSGLVNPPGANTDRYTPESI